MTPVASRWKLFLSTERLRLSEAPARGDEDNEFHADYGRVVFSSAFRRLQDKTQVNPLASTDFVRRRLTHSVEVATVGERMGRVIGRLLEHRCGTDSRENIGKIVATACLLHDIGNPPFGHEGECAIREWADGQEDASPDYRCFNGNAQGFRIAVRLQHHGKSHGLNLTAATLATLLKYPLSPGKEHANGRVHERGNWGVMSSEAVHYERVRNAVGLGVGQRHPLSYIVEAADDIVNRLVDLEDAIKLRLVTFKDVVAAVESVNEPYSNDLLDRLRTHREAIKHGADAERDLWAYQDFRVAAAASLAKSCERLFVERIDEIEDGRFPSDLIKGCDQEPLYKVLKNLEYEKIFGDPAIVRIEAGGKEAIKGLLDRFLADARGGGKLFATVPTFPLLDEDKLPQDHETRRIVDYVAGMTDRFAITLYQELSGMSL